MAKKSAAKKTAAEKTATKKGKRKPTGYIVFATKRLKERGDTEVKMMMKKIGAEWRGFSDAEKKKWNNEAAKK